MAGAGHRLGYAGPWARADAIALSREKQRVRQKSAQAGLTPDFLIIPAPLNLTISAFSTTATASPEEKRLIRVEVAAPRVALPILWVRGRLPG